MNDEENIYEDENGIDLSTAVLLVDSHHGQYIPQEFAERYEDAIIKESISQEDFESIQAGPDDEWYFDSWSNIIDNCVLIINGRQHTLYESEDLFALPVYIEPA